MANPRNLADLSFDAGTLHIDRANNRVGVGTSSPDEKLAVTGVLKLNGVSAPTWDTATRIWMESGFGTRYDGYNHRFDVGNSRTEAVRITPAGNVGIGTASPSAFCHTSGAGVGFKHTNGTKTIQLYSDGTNGVAEINAPYVLRTTTADPMIFGTTNAERMRIDSSGNVGIGTSSPSSIAGYTTLTLNNATNGGNLVLQTNGTTVGSIYAANSVLSIYGNTGVPIVFQAGGSERVRIDSSGNVQTTTGKWIGTSSGASYVPDDGVFGGLIKNGGGFKIFTGAIERFKIDAGGTLFLTATAGDALYINHQVDGNHVVNISQVGSTGTRFFNFVKGENNVGNIFCTTTSTAYNTSSDYRLKEDIQPMTNALATVAQLNPVTYKWKVDGSDGHGFIAHELQAVVPNAVTGEKDAVDKDGNPQYQGVDTSFLVATLTAAIQELKAEFDAYKAAHP